MASNNGLATENKSNGKNIYIKLVFYTYSFLKSRPFGNKKNWQKHRFNVYFSKIANSKAAIWSRILANNRLIS
jgi:hypothetical protein